MINVTKPFLPPKEAYYKYLDEIWSRGWLTNNGPLVNELELRLKDYLRLNHLLYVNNGTIAIQIAIKALDLKGEVITTPFSYVATTSSLVWENCKPVFVDIDPLTLNIDPGKIEAAITKKTTAILATHVFGIPCQVEQIEKIAKEHNLKVIYDAAHCFGTWYKGKSLFEYGDISTTSFHATKLFHTVEGGAVMSNSPELIARMAKMRNFGHDGPFKFSGVGINGKNSEYHAAMGLANLQFMDEILKARKHQYLRYQERMEDTLKVEMPSPPDDKRIEWNYAYCPVLFGSEQALLKAQEALHQHYIYPRRYFSPSLNELDYVTSTPCPIAEDASRRILCLPIYHELSDSTIDLVVRVLHRAQNF